MINFTSRGVMIERGRAVDGARNPAFSKLGQSCMDNYTKPDKSLMRSLSSLNNQIRRMEAEARHRKTEFVKRSQVLNYEPMILVERPASPEVQKKAHAIRVATQLGENYETESEKPRYMRQLRKQVKTPSTLTTIDSFTVKSKKKQNTWEEVRDQGEQLEFKSLLRPFSKLTDKERSDLQIGWSIHKPRLIGQDEQDTENKKKKSKSPTRKKTPALEPDGDEDELTPFITQIAQVRRHSSRGQETTTKENKHKVHFASRGNSARSTPSRKSKIPPKTKIAY